jgi:hypothetical protein
MNIRPVTEKDWDNARALIKHLQRCHRAALEVPGATSQLTPANPECGPHMDLAFLWVETLLFHAERHCDRVHTLQDQGERIPPRAPGKAA